MNWRRAGLASGILLGLAGLVGCEAAAPDSPPIVQGDQCASAGLSGCLERTRVVCAQGDGHRVWVPVAECGFGCKDAACIPGGNCGDQCPTEGLTGCQGNRLLTCAMGDGCRVWAEVASCARGCENGACIQDVARDQCPGIGVSGCLGNTRVVCERGDGIYVWVPVSECQGGCRDGACLPGGVCDDQCPGEGVTGCSGDRLVVCAQGDGCQVWASVATCTKGCDNGACRGADSCTNDCPTADARDCDGNTVRLCVRGSDGCLRWTATTPCANGCADGYCTDVNPCVDRCERDGAWDCRGATQTRCMLLDGCLDWVDVQTCPASCTDGQCDTVCRPACADRECGDDGCDGSCGTCQEPAQCVEGTCQTTCVPNCYLRECGNDGCKGSCGSCSGGAVCQSGDCVCTPQVGKTCCGGNVCWIDSCGGTGSVVAPCAYGCESGACKACVPACSGRECGPDGCGGTCGTCGQGKVCNDSGRCEVQIGAMTVTGRLTYDARYPAVSGSRIYMGPVEIEAGAGAIVRVSDTSGRVLGTAQTDANGDFSIPLSRQLTGSERVVFATLWGPTPTGSAVLAVLKPPSGGEPRSFTSSPWAWTFPIPLNGQLGTLHVREAQGSGALHLLLYSMSAMTETLENVLGGDASKVITLALLWSPGISWTCGACYWAGGFQSLSGGGSLSHSIYIGGESDGSSAWGYPVILHEFGHYVANSYSRDDSPGGSHAIGELISPPFAWSEGWASFFATATMSRWVNKASPIFWDIQEGSSFWIDYASATSMYPGYPIAAKLNGTITQSLDESWVASMLWHLWDGQEIPEPTGDSDGTALGMARVLYAIQSNRFLYRDRGASGVDFVDFADAISCQYPSLGSGMEKTIRDHLSFPYLLGGATCY